MKLTSHLKAKHTLKPLTVAVLFALSNAAIADAIFTPIFSTNYPPSSSYATAVSSDGTVTAGNYNSIYAFVLSDNNLLTSAIGSLGGTYSEFYALSSDGSTIVGDAGTANGGRHAFHWTVGTGIIDLGTLGGSNNASYAKAVSSNGSVVVGSSYDINNYMHAFLWTSSTGMTDLGTLGGTTNASYAWGVSADGSAVMGDSFDASNNFHAFRWTSGTGMVDLGTLGGSYSYSTANAISANGSVVVGGSYITSNIEHAFRWTTSTGMVDLGSLSGGSYDYSVATGVSADGNAVIGQSNNASNYQRAFRWTSATGMVDLGSLGGNTTNATAISADGSTVVGHSYTAGDTQALAFRWTQITGIQSIATWLTNAGVTMPAGWVLTSADAVNQNGNVIVGEGTNPNGQVEAWLARVGSGGGSLISNLAAFNNGIAHTSSMTSQNGLAMPNMTLFGAHHRTLMDDGLVHTANGSCAWSTTDYAHSNSANSDTQIIEVGGCKDVGDTRIGLGVGKNWSRQAENQGYSGKFNGQYLVAEADHLFTGWNNKKNIEGSFLAYYGEFNTELHRTYTDGSTVDSYTGTPDMQSVALRARLDWKDAAQWKSYSFSPYAAYTWTQSDVAAYTESSGSFPTTYQATTSRINDIRIGTAANTELTAKTSMRIGTEAVHRMESSTSGVNAQVLGTPDSVYLPGSAIRQDWVRATLDFDHLLTKTTALTFGGNAATPGGDASWGLTAGLHAIF